MFPRRRHRLVTVLFALFSLLSMQLAVAGYACPVTGKTAAIAEMAAAGMPCAGDMAIDDEDQPALCHAHCQSVQSSVDKVQPSVPTALSATGFSYTVTVLAVPDTPRPAQAPLLLRSTAPPIAVRHCCFRI